MNQPESPSTAAAQPVSARIRQRLARARVRFHANDNIAAFIEPGELPLLQAEVEDKLAQVLQSLVIDTDSDHNTRETARRVARMYLNEVFSGRYRAAPDVTDFPNVERLNELMIVGPITIRSACSHHLCPIIGKVWIGVMPNEHSNLIGLSKYVRLADWVMSRPQIQEEAVTRLADLLQERMQPDVIEQTANTRNLKLLVSLRWLAVAGQIVIIGVAQQWLHLDLPLLQTATVNDWLRVPELIGNKEHA